MRCNCFVHLIRRRYGPFVAYSKKLTEKKNLYLRFVRCAKKYHTISKIIPFWGCSFVLYIRFETVYILKFRSPIKNQNATTSSFKKRGLWWILNVGMNFNLLFFLATPGIGTSLPAFRTMCKKIPIRRNVARSNPRCRKNGPCAKKFVRIFLS